MRLMYYVCVYEKGRGRGRGKSETCKNLKMENLTKPLENAFTPYIFRLTPNNHPGSTNKLGEALGTDKEL